MTGDTGVIWRGSQAPTPPMKVLLDATNGGAGGRVLQQNLPQGERRYIGGPAFDHHLQCGDGRSGPPLGI